MTLIPDQEGYWGTRTSSHDFCEPNYYYTYYIAEFWNTMTSFVIILTGIYGMYNCMKYNSYRRFFVGYLLIALVGVGSVSFHATLSRLGQALDELPMIYATLAFAYPLLEITSNRGERKYSWLIPLMIAYSICFTLAYVLTPTLFAVFIVTYVFSVLILLIKALSVASSARGSAQQNWMLYFAGGLYTFQFLFIWIPEQFFCTYLQPLHPHAIFHIGSAVSCYLFVSYFYYETFRRRKTTDVEMRYDRIGGILPVPYVHFTDIRIL